ncbi:MAG: HAMP domain-containing histidine kinase [Synechococcaceae cyanobacterium SM2_3_1]|nr:HAMP domain-containing histidine kinase [Synechococcaceae cyanobacterium SM2_3_1]
MTCTVLLEGVRTYRRLRYQWTRSMRAQVAFLIACLSFVPNLALIMATFWLSPPDVPLTWIVGIITWVVILGISSAAVGYLSAHYMLRPLTRLAGELSYLENVLQQPEAWTLIPRPEDPTEALILRQAFAQLLKQLRLEQETRNAFTATLMHDLKTPLIAFNHLLVTLRDQPGLARDQQEEILTQLLQESERILSLVQKLVEVHRLERGDLQLQLQHCDLGEMAQNLVRRLLPLAQQRHLQLFAEGQATAHVDPSELERALYNLVDNGLRYARQQVLIHVSPAEIRVCDDGPGLPAPLEELAQPFGSESFEIAGQRYTSRTSGLGLFIARSILESHGGSLRLIHSDSQGTTLAMILPASPAQESTPTSKSV